MNETPEVHTAIDAVRCLYLAREAQRRGDEVTAKRWHDKAAAWMARPDGGVCRLDDQLPSSRVE